MVLHLLLEHGSSLRKPRRLKLCAHMTLAAFWVIYSPQVLSWLPQWALAHLLLGVVLHRISPAKSKMKKHLQKCSDKPHIYQGTIHIWLPQNVGIFGPLPTLLSYTESSNLLAFVCLR